MQHEQVSGEENTWTWSMVLKLRKPRTRVVVKILIGHNHLNKQRHTRRGKLVPQSEQYARKGKKTF